MLIGRESELAAIDAALAGHRLVTLTGPGGVGKTALAESIAERHGGQFVDLTPLSGPSIKEGMAGASRYRSFAEMRRAIDDHGLLVVLDNCEHVLAAVSELCSELLGSSSGGRVLATSREALGLASEWIVPIAPLATSGSPSPAEKLFRYEATRRGFGDLPGAEADITDLCERLDGLPLALELAATRLAVLTPGEILQDIRERLDLLSRSQAHGPRRHSSLSAAIGWSYASLSPDEQRLFGELSILPSPFSVEAMTAVTSLSPDAVIDALSGLIGRSLLIHLGGAPMSQYRMLETLRTYATEKLAGDRVDLEQRLRDYALSVADRLIQLAGDAHTDVPVILAREYRILHTALTSFIAKGEPQRGARVIAALWWLEDVGHQAEAADTVEQAVAAWPEVDRLGPTWGVLAALHRYAGRRPQAEQAADRALQAPDPLGHAYALRVMGQFQRSDGQWDVAAELFKRGIDAAHVAGAATVALEIEIHLAVTEARSGAVDDGIERLASVCDRSQHLTLVHLVATTFRSWLTIARDADAAAVMATDVLAIAEPIHYHWGAASAHLVLSLTHLAAGRIAEAAAHVRAGLQGFQAINDRTAITLALLAASAVLARSGDLTEAAATAAARQTYLVGELGTFERALFRDAGALIDDTSDLDPLSLAAVVELLERIESGSSAEPNRMVLRDGICTLQFAGQKAQLPANKGIADLSALVRQPGQEIAALDLMGAGVVSGDTGPHLDHTARRAYEDRIRQLQDELDEAGRLGDRSAAAQQEAELDQLVQELASAYGLSGRARRSGATAEKARSAVTHRIRDAIGRIAEIHPALGDHLRQSVRTGRFCAYAPEHHVEWEVHILAEDRHS